MQLPNLIIAGAPKSGTTSVFRWLADHPDVAGSVMKETYFFVDPGSHMFNRRQHFLSSGLEGYARLFHSGAKCPAIILEATPAYLYSHLALQTLPHLPSSPAFLFLLREPVSQLKSLFNYFRSNWGWIPPGMTFSEFVEASRARRDVFNGNELARDAVGNARYVEFLRRWREACGPDRMHVFLLEELVSQQRPFMKRLAARLGIDPKFYDSYGFPKENETYEVKLNALQKVNFLVRPYIPRGAFYDWLRARYRRVNTRAPVKDAVLDSELERALRESFREANRSLAIEFGLDLSAWGIVDPKPSGLAPNMRMLVSAEQ